MAGVKYESYLNKYVLKTTFKGWEGMGKLDVRGYVVPNFRFRVTEQPFGKLSRDLRLLQKILIR